MSWDTIENRWRQFQDVLRKSELADTDFLRDTNDEQVKRFALLQKQISRDAPISDEADDEFDFEFTGDNQDLILERAGNESRWQDDGGADQSDDDQNGAAITSQ